jgi:hypothetical protein
MVLFQTLIILCLTAMQGEKVVTFYLSYRKALI